MGIIFEDIKMYVPDDGVHFPGAMYFMDSKGRDWYKTIWPITKAVPVVMVDPDTGYVRSWTTDANTRPLSLVAGCSVYEVDVAPIEEAPETWDWFLDVAEGTLYRKALDEAVLGPREESVEGDEEDKGGTQ